MNKNWRYYLAGPMSGHENFNRPRFNEIAAILRDQDFSVWNPAELEVEGDDYNQYMREGLSRLVECHALILIPGWETSKGTKIEIMLARILHMPIYLYGDELQEITRDIDVHYSVRPLPRGNDVA